MTAKVLSGFWCSIPTEILEDENLSLLARLVYTKVASLCTKEGYCWASNKFIGDCLKRSPRQISLSINTLIKEGYLKTEVIQGKDKRFLRYIYLAVSLKGITGNPPTPPRGNPQESKIKKSKIKEVGIYSDNGYFQQLWDKYPSKDGRKNALKNFQRTVKTKEDWDNINKALNNYLSSKRVAEGYVKNGSTWFNQWEDFVNWKEAGKYDPLEGRGIYREVD